MRVLQVIPTLATRTGGPPVAVVESSIALERCGVEVTVFATDMAEAASAPSHARMQASDLPAGAGQLDVRLFPAREPRRLAFSPAMHEAIAAQASSYDVIHIHSLFLFPQLTAARNARRSAVPYVVSPRGSLDPHLRRRGRLVKWAADVAWQRRALEGAAALHCTTEEEARLTRDIASGVRRQIVPNGIDWQRFQSRGDGVAFRRTWFGGADGPLVLFVGRMSHKKGIDLLVRAFAAVARERTDALLAVAGPDDEGLIAPLRALADSLGCGARVAFTEMLAGDAKLDALAAADVWALPSQTENFGNAVVEAMAAGVPVVISPQVNIAGDVRAAGAGVVVERTPEAFAREIEALLREGDRRDAIAGAGREFARRYDWSSVGPQLAAMYSDVVARRN